MSPATADYPPMNQTHPTPAGTGKPAMRRRGIGPAATMGLVLFAALVVGGDRRCRRGAGDLRVRELRASPTRPLLEKIELPRAVRRLRPDRQDRARPLRRVQPRGRRRSTDIPPVLVDATTAVEDAHVLGQRRASTRSASSAAGIDSFRGHPRGASTITQQLVRQRLLYRAPVAGPSSSASRKLKEIIQSIRSPRRTRASRASSGSWPRT